MKKSRTITNKDKSAHAEDHKLWSRRDFLSATGMLATGSMLLGKMNIRSFLPTPIMASLSASETDRVLVLIRLDGGNDGLNTIIERGNTDYYDLRPTIAIQENNMWALNTEYGMPLATSDLQPMWQDGMMKAIFNVGYPEPNYSHFRSYDIVASASDSDEYLNTGWIGRFLDNQYPTFLETPPTIPPALQIGVQSNLVFRADAANMALAVSSPQEFYQIAQSGQLYDTESLGNTPRELELAFMRQTANSAFRYAATIQDAYGKGKNAVTYPSNDNSLAEQLSIVARLIKGGLGTKVYMVEIGGFDTHAEQYDFHLTLLNHLSTAVKLFYDDLADAGLQNKVLAMTFSEFGRTIYENGSLGTDHGWGTHAMLFGGGLGNGLVGNYQDLSNPDPYVDPNFSVDFRSLYGTVLQDWLGSDPDMIRYVMGQPFAPISGLVPATTPPIGTNDEKALLGHQPHPDNAAFIQIKYSLSSGGATRIELLDTAGHPLRILYRGIQTRGSHILNIQRSDLHLPPGAYRYRMLTGGKVYERKIRL